MLKRGTVKEFVVWEGLAAECKAHRTEALDLVQGRFPNFYEVLKGTIFLDLMLADVAGSARKWGGK